MSQGLGEEGADTLRPKHRYSLLSRLGEGGMGDVYLAQQKGSGRRVAMKILKADFARDPVTVERFLREAQATAQIRHENVVEILDVGRSRAGQVFFVMELLEGQELGAVLHAEHRLSWHRARNILLQICSALATAHAAGVIHRDMKPDNVFLLERDGRRDRVKILDFGIAKIEGAQALTQAGMVFGTAGYMAPEQVMASAVDGRTDIYAVACMAFEMLTGVLPFRDKAPMRVLNMHLREPAPSMCQLAPDAGIPATVDAVILRALAKQPDERFTDMLAFRRALEAIPAGPPPLRRPAPSPADSASATMSAAISGSMSGSAMSGSASASASMSASSSASGRQRTQVHTGPAATPTTPTATPTTPPRRPPRAAPATPPPTAEATPQTSIDAPRQAQATMLMTQPPPEIPAVHPELQPDLLREVAAPSRIDDEPSQRITEVPTQRPAPIPAAPTTTPPGTPRRQAQTTAMMSRPPLPQAAAPAAPLEPAPIDGQALAHVFLGLAHTLAGTPATLPMDTLVKHVRSWLRERPAAETRALTLETWSALMILPDEARRQAQVLDEAGKLASLPRDKAIELGNELYEIAGRVGPVSTAAHRFIVAVLGRLGVAADLRLRGIAYLNMTLAHGPERLDARELRELRNLLPRWAPQASPAELELLIRWSLAEFEHRPTMQERWQHAYALADQLTQHVSLDEARAVMADLRTIADADGYIDNRERELLGEMSKRFAALAGL